MDPVDIAVLDGACTRHDNVTLAKLTYPKQASTFKHSCRFQSATGVWYRLRPTADYRRHRLGHGVSNAERMGGLDVFHTYTLWTQGTEVDAHTQAITHLIYYAKATPLPFNVALLADMAERAGVAWGKLPDELTHAPGDLRITTAWKVFEKHSEKKAVQALDHATPYFRKCRGASLFRIWPQAALMDLSFRAFVRLVKLLRNVTSVEAAELAVTSLCFRWLLPVSTLPTLDIEGLLAIHRHYDYGETAGFNRNSWRLFTLCIEFYQKSLRQLKRDGHTFGTHLDLARAYMAAIEWAERTKPTARDLVSDVDTDLRADKLTRAMVESAIKTHESMARRLGIVKRRVETIDPESKRSRDNMQRVLYAMDDWIAQDYVTRAINEMVSKRWKRERHADGCRTYADVEAHIDARKGPRFPEEGPHWENPLLPAFWHERLDAKQRRAVANMVISPISFVTGQPGCGKTEVLRAAQLLFHPEDLLPLAAYGRIAKNLDSRLVSTAYTFHRAEATVEYRGGTDSAIRIIDASTMPIDEFGLVTHDHLLRVMRKAGDAKCRMIMCGDVDQLGAIGSGSIVQSIYARFHDNPNLFTQLDVPHRFLPERGAGWTSARLEEAVATRPAPDDPMAVPWNMRTLLAFSGTPRATHVDLACVNVPRTGKGHTYTKAERGRFAAARLLVFPWAGTLVATLEALRSIADIDVSSEHVQVLVRTNARRAEINRAARFLLKGTLPTHPHDFAIGEKIVFGSNKYLETPTESSSETAPDTPNDGFGDVTMDYTGLATEFSFSRKRTHALAFDSAESPWRDIGTDGASTQVRARKRPRTDLWRGTDSENVFNGDIHRVSGVYDVQARGVKKGSVLNTLRTTRDTKSTRGDRIMGFSDGTQLNLAAYDKQNIHSAICLTVPKMQGSEQRRVVYFCEPNDSCDHLYTGMTRGADQCVFVPIGITTVTGAHDRLAEVADREPRKRRERFAYYLDIEAD